MISQYLTVWRNLPTNNNYVTKIYLQFSVTLVIISRTLCPKIKRATAQELLKMCKRLTINSMEPNRNPGTAVARPQARHLTTILQTDLAELSISDSILSVYNESDSEHLSPDALQQLTTENSYRFCNYVH